MINIDPAVHEQLKREIVGVYDRFENIFVSSKETLMYSADEHDWWDWEWSQGSRFWVEGMSPEGLEKFKSVSFENLKKMKGPNGIPILDGARLAIANAPVPTR